MRASRPLRNSLFPGASHCLSFSFLSSCAPDKDGRITFNCVLFKDTHLFYRATSISTPQWYYKRFSWFTFFICFIIIECFSDRMLRFWMRVRSDLQVFVVVLAQPSRSCCNDARRDRTWLQSRVKLRWTPRGLGHASRLPLIQLKPTYHENDEKYCV